MAYDIKSGINGILNNKAEWQIGNNTHDTKKKNTAAQNAQKIYDELRKNGYAAVSKHCHHVNNKLPIELINKVPNLAWLCERCHRMVHNSPIPSDLNQKTVKKILKYREKLNK